MVAVVAMVAMVISTAQSLKLEGCNCYRFSIVAVVTVVVMGCNRRRLRKKGVKGIG